MPITSEKDAVAVPCARKFLVSRCVAGFFEAPRGRHLESDAAGPIVDAGLFFREPEPIAHALFDLDVARAIDDLAKPLLVAHDYE